MFPIVESSPQAMARSQKAMPGASAGVKNGMDMLQVGQSLEIPLDAFVSRNSLSSVVLRHAKTLPNASFRIIKHFNCYEVARVNVGTTETEGEDDDA